MKPYQLIAASALALTVLAGCTTTGMGRGEMITQGRLAEPVKFSWKSTDGGLSGSMVATLPDATYTGRFFQITRQTQQETLAPMWDGWSAGWYDWPYGDQSYPPMYTATQFVTYYSGKVVANLATGDGQRMRCRFHLANPAKGMSDGGLGECQLADGRIISATF